MTIEALEEAIKRLIIKRREAHGNEEEQKRINESIDRPVMIKIGMGRLRTNLIDNTIGKPHNYTYTVSAITEVTVIYFTKAYITCAL